MATQLEQFRQALYESFPGRADGLMDLLDALSSNTHARSVIELSLSPLFRRGYSSVHDSIDVFFEATDAERAEAERRGQEERFLRLIAGQLPQSQQRKWWLFGIDVTSTPRPFARTLQDRSFVHRPNPIAGNKPVTIGHQYSVLAFLPEKEGSQSPPWVVPLSVRRVSSEQSTTQVGAQQIRALLTDKTLPFHNELCVQVEDSAYSAVEFLGRVADHENLVTVARLRSNRVVYRAWPAVEKTDRARGHPRWYGERFDLKDPTSWGPPDVVSQTRFTSRRGRTYTVHLQGWHNLLMRGKRNLPMHQHPFTLIRISMMDANGQPAFQRPLWLVVIGKGREELSLIDAWQAYGQRYDLEHCFRFGKQRLLLTAYQTPVVEHEENWWHIVLLAYVQLWLARTLAQDLPRPWERYLPHTQTKVDAPPRVQRDFGRIIRQIGTPALLPKPRGKSPGRAKGERPRRRNHPPVVKKGTAKPKKAQSKA